MIKKYLISFAYTICTIILLTLLLSITNYFINLPTYVIKILIPIISILVGSIILGKSTKEKAYLEGIKFSGFYIILSIILKLILKTNFNYKVIILYICLLCSGIIGSMIGINSKRG